MSDSPAVSPDELYDFSEGINPLSMLPASVPEPTAEELRALADVPFVFPDPPDGREVRYAYEFLGTDTLSSSADLLLLGYVSDALWHRGYVLSLEGSSITYKSVTPSSEGFLRMRLTNGTAMGNPYLFTEHKATILEVPRDQLQEVLPFDTQGPLYWSGKGFAYQHTSMLVGPTTLAFLAEFLVRRVLEEEDRDLSADVYVQQKGNLRAEVIYLVTHNPVLLKFGSYTIFHGNPGEVVATTQSDVDYQGFIYQAQSQGNLRTTTLPEKLSLMETEGMRPGGIYILWEKDRISEANPVGRIISSKLVRLDEVGEHSITITSIPLRKTYEETYVELQKMGTEVMDFFHDMLHPDREGFRTEVYSFNSLSIGSVFLNEAYMLTPIDRLAVVSHYMLNEGAIVKQTMSEPEMVFFILIEHGVQFDSSRFIEEYDLHPSWAELAGRDFRGVLEQIRKNHYVVRGEI